MDLCVRDGLLRAVAVALALALPVTATEDGIARRECVSPASNLTHARAADIVPAMLDSIFSIASRPRFVGAGSALRSCGLAVLLLGATGCTTTTAIPFTGPAPAAPAAVPVESGFLSDYSTLQASDQYAALKLYRDASHKGGYRKLYFRPVEVWRGADKRLEDVSEEDLQYLADALYQAVDKRLSRSFEMASAPGPGVLEIHLAFTLVTDPESSIDFFSTAVPVKDLARREGALVDGTKRFVLDCALEAEFTEATSAASSATGSASVQGKRGARPARATRAAFFDARRDKDTPKGSVQTWEEVHTVFEKWAGVLDERLASLRDGTFKPRLTVGQKSSPQGAKP